MIPIIGLEKAKKKKRKETIHRSMVTRGWGEGERD